MLFNVVKHAQVREATLRLQRMRGQLWLTISDKGRGFDAQALSKTGGRLVTIDIDEGRHREALRNFKDAGVAEFVDARLGDAHEIVPRLAGPLDMVFIDADKDWYTNYAKAVLPKIAAGGALTAHNVSPRGGRQMTGDFYSYATSLPDVETSFRAGVFVALKK
jgi:predicted O-methyltransferase YrrM